jgi:hypothetical protein
VLLASNGPQRSAHAPNVPSLAEFIPGFDFAPVIGIFGRSGTSPPAVEKIVAEALAVASESDIVRQLAVVGVEAGRRRTAGVRVGTAGGDATCHRGGPGRGHQTEIGAHGRDVGGRTRPMPKLELSIATADYDRVRPLVDGAVAIDGVAPVFMTLDPEEIFFRAFRHAEFDIAELSLSSFTVRTARGDNPYVGVPVFPSRAFRHSGIYIRTDRGIRAPADLEGPQGRPRRISAHRQRLDTCLPR